VCSPPTQSTCQHAPPAKEGCRIPAHTPPRPFIQPDVALQVVQFGLCSCTTHDKTRQETQTHHTRPNKASHTTRQGRTHQLGPKSLHPAGQHQVMVRPLRKCCSCLPAVAPLCAAACATRHTHACTQAGPLGVAPKRYKEQGRSAWPAQGRMAARLAPKPHTCAHARTHEHARRCCWVGQAAVRSSCRRSGPSGSGCAERAGCMSRPLAVRMSSLKRSR
jgi:hypothetical protein